MSKITDLEDRNTTLMARVNALVIANDTLQVQRDAEAAGRVQAERRVSKLESAIERRSKAPDIRLDNLLDVWGEEYSSIKEQILVFNGKPGGVRYCLLAAEAMRLHECIVELMQFIGAAE